MFVSLWEQKFSQMRSCVGCRRQCNLCSDFYSEATAVAATDVFLLLLQLMTWERTEANGSSKDFVKKKKGSDSFRFFRPLSRSDRSEIRSHRSFRDLFFNSIWFPGKKPKLTERRTKRRSSN